MFDAEFFHTAAVLGAGKSAASASELLSKHGVTVVNLPDADACRRYFTSGANGFTGATPKDIRLLALSPGIPFDFAGAVPANIKIMSELELGWLFCPESVRRTLTAVTGTNGKSTTVAITGEMFRADGYTCETLGNIGVPLSSYVGAERVVTEVSSFMLEAGGTFAPHVAALLNISPDHLDRHGTMENYLRLKKRIFENQTAEDFALLNADDPAIGEVKTRAQAVSFGMDARNGAYVRGGGIYFRDKKIAEISAIRLSGQHNLYNCLAAVAAAVLGGVSAGAVECALRSFGGLPHRMQLVRRVRGVDFYNDSKATNCDAAIRALYALNAPLVTIMGGSDKGEDYTPLIRALSERNAYALFTGFTADAMARSAIAEIYTDFIIADSFEEAVTLAFDAAKKRGASVLLSPACASFDRFSSFEERGKYYEELVKML